MRLDPMHSPLLGPLIALVLWTFVMWAWLYATRIPAIVKGKIEFDPRRPSRIAGSWARAIFHG